MRTVLYDKSACFCQIIRRRSRLGIPSPSKNRWLSLGCSDCHPEKLAGIALNGIAEMYLWGGPSGTCFPQEASSDNYNGISLFVSNHS